MKRVRNIALGTAVLIAGVIGLLLPVSVWDGQASTIVCGNAVVVEADRPVTANDAQADVAPAPGPAVLDVAAACDSAISGRRHWAIPLVIVGTAGVLLGFVASKPSRVRRGGR